MEHGHMNCVMFLLSISTQLVQSPMIGKVDVNVDRWISSVLVPNLTQSIVIHKETLRLRVEPKYLELKAEIAARKAVRERRSRSMFRYFWG